MKFIVIICAYNCERWIQKCVSSLISQTYKLYECYIIDDVSTDNTPSKIKGLISGYENINFIQNKIKYYQTGNYDQIIRSSSICDDDIIVQLDGDDWFSDKNVLQRLNRYYSFNDIWMTFGQFKYSDGKIGFAQKLETEPNFRKDNFNLTHLRTHKAFLWRSIVRCDLLHNNWYPKRAGDMFFMLPMAEMATSKHIMFVEEINYIYNDENPLNDNKLSLKEQNELAKFAREKRPYKPLNYSLRFLTKHRFDIAAKVLLARFEDKKINSNFAVEVYKEHIKAFTNGTFTEYDNINKNSFEKYLGVFRKILSSISTDNFDKRFKVPVDLKGNLLNGSHRVSACILYNKIPSTFISSNDKDGQLICDFNFFKKMGLKSKYLDAMALHYCKLKDNTKIITLYPARSPDTYCETFIENLILSNLSVVYIKSVDLNQNGFMNLISQIYLNEHWLNDDRNNFAGLKAKVGLCTGRSRLKVFLVECEDLNKINSIKQEIRKFYKIEKSSVHINDTHDETLRIAKILFNNNSIFFLNYANHNHLNSIWNRINELKDYIISNKLKVDDFCITGSYILELFNLRQSRDIDFLYSFEGSFDDLSNYFGSHESEIEYYQTHKHDIIYNDFNHFYFNDIKFAKIDIVKKLKENRKEKKDLFDVTLIKEYLNGQRKC